MPLRMTPNVEMVLRRIGWVMEARNTNRSKLAKIIGISRAGLGQKLRGERPITLVELCYIACALDVRPDLFYMDFKEEDTTEFIKLYHGLFAQPSEIRFRILKYWVMAGDEVRVLPPVKK